MNVWVLKIVGVSGSLREGRSVAIKLRGMYSETVDI